MSKRFKEVEKLVDSSKFYSVEEAVAMWKKMIDERKMSSSVNTNIIQNIILENREKITISGVLDVLSFDDQIVILETELGLLNIKGENLKINKLSIDTGDVIVEGDIINLGYSEKDIERKSGNIFGKIFK